MIKLGDGVYEATCQVCGMKLQIQASTKAVAIARARMAAGWSFGRGKTGSPTRSYCKKHCRKRVGG